MKPAWWKSSVVYQIYPRSFCDGGGNGDRNGDMAFKYLAPHVFRVALSNRRLVKFEDERVTHP